jgi:hypothetical protein
MYAEKLEAAAAESGADLSLRAEPLYSLEETEVWVAEAESSAVDGLVLVTLDRQQHAWPSARRVAAGPIRSIIYSPLGTSFTTNTAEFADRAGTVVYSTDDFRQAAFGMKMLCAAARMRNTRCAVIMGEDRGEDRLPDFGILLRRVPVRDFFEDYQRQAETPEMSALADDYIRRARRMTGATRQDVINGVKSYFVAGHILERAEADAVTMDCLGALASLPISLPCISWSRMNDEGIPAACEADLGAVASHILVQYLFDRPGFQQDPVADTADDTVIGAHCSCPTKLRGFEAGPEPFDLMHHHGNRDAVPRTLWRAGQRVTCVDVLPGDGRSSSEMLISAGTVVGNMEVPPSGGCVVSVKVKFDGDRDVLSYPGFHQLFFYGDFTGELEDFCRLTGTTATRL